MKAVFTYFQGNYSGGLLIEELRREAKKNRTFLNRANGSTSKGGLVSVMTTLHDGFTTEEQCAPGNSLLEPEGP